MELEPGLNAYGAHPAHYTGHDCTGCGICFYCCPEPGAITVYRIQGKAKTLVATPTPEPVPVSGGEHAAGV
jgi:MinD superfamily P-loop ATPase